MEGTLLMTEGADPDGAPAAAASSAQFRPSHLFQVLMTSSESQILTLVSEGCVKKTVHFHCMASYSIYLSFSTVGIRHEMDFATSEYKKI